MKTGTIKSLFWGMAVTLVVTPINTYAADLSDMQRPMPFMKAIGMDDHMNEHGDHGRTPAGVFGANMLNAGAFMLAYTPTFMHMADNYIGTSVVSPEQIVTAVPTNMMMSPNYRIVPSSMDVQMHMVHAMYGVNDWLTLTAMGSYVYKTMTMTTFAGMMGTRVLGESSASTEGFGDTAIGGMVRVYQDSIHHVHLNLGLSLPSGSTTETVRMLSPMGTMMTMRANYGMQLGTGTVDFLPGLTYTGHLHQWSWGAAYRGRVAFGDNDQGYHFGDLHEFTGWGGYTWVPGLTTTARIAGSVQDHIHGADPQITGLMQGTNPLFYGGKRIDLFGGVEFMGKPYGLGNTRLALEGGGPVYQDLNGPQLGRAWQITAALSVGF